MKITGITTSIQSSRFSYGAPSGPGGNLHLKDMDTLLVRIETDAGLHGWGEGFGFTLVQTTRQAVDQLLAPALVGEEIGDIPALMHRMAKRFHNFGRNGAVTFGLSGIDIALWDIAAKAQGKPLHALLGSANRARVPAYASLLRYGVPELVAANTARAVAEGYRLIKLHEVDVACIAAARAAAPPEVPLMLDINCAFDDVPSALAFAEAVSAMNIAWIEEPTWPPEDAAPTAAVRKDGGLPVAAGENCGSVADFARLFLAGAVDVAQPSVTKIGGITGMLAVAALAERHGLRLVPHSPYFGPGLLATLHVLAASEQEEPLEVYYADLDQPPYAALQPKGGYVDVPAAPGLGIEPQLYG